jgi:hypothetical protein
MPTTCSAHLVLPDLIILSVKLIKYYTLQKLVTALLRKYLVPYVAVPTRNIKACRSNKLALDKWIFIQHGIHNPYKMYGSPTIHPLVIENVRRSAGTG